MDCNSAPLKCKCISNTGSRKGVVTVSLRLDVFFFKYKTAIGILQVSMISNHIPALFSVRFLFSSGGN